MQWDSLVRTDTARFVLIIIRKDTLQTHAHGRSIKQPRKPTLQNSSNLNGANPSFCENQRIWGEAGTVTIKRPRLQNPSNRIREFLVCWCGMLRSTEANVIECGTQRQHWIHQTRDVIWLFRLYYPTPRNEIVVVAVGEADDKPDADPVTE